MSTITLKGTPIHTVGELPYIGTPAPDFTLTKTDLSEVHLQDFRGKKVVLNIFPSLDTEICARSVHRMHEEANKFKDIVFLCISADLPFAHNRFCITLVPSKIIALSVFRHPEFGKDYGLTIVDGPLRGLLSRAVVIVNEQGKIIYTDQVPEIADEPNYEAAMTILQSTVTP